MAFGGSCNSETPQPISIKLGISDHIAHPTHMLNLVTIGSKGGGVATHARNSPLGVYFFFIFIFILFFFFIFLGTATGPHVESTNTANGSNEAS